MSILGGAGKEAGADAAREIHATVDEALPQIGKIADGMESAVKESLTTALAGIADGVSQIVGIGLRLDGATVQLDGVEISIKNPRLTLNLGPYKGE